MNSNEQIIVEGNKSLILMTNVSRPINVDIHYKNKYKWTMKPTQQEEKGYPFSYLQLLAILLSD